MESGTPQAQSATNRVDTVPQNAPDLAQRGPYPIGVRTRPLPTRVPGRSLLTEEWYPAVEGTPAGGTYATLLRDGETKITLHGRACRDAVPASGSFPLVILSHGYPGNRFLMAHLGEALASHGFHVASPDHPGSTYDDQRAFGETLLHRMGDVRAVADAIAALRYAIIGYSMGGYGALVAGGAGISDGALTRPDAPSAASWAVWQRPEVDPRLAAILPIGPWGGKQGIWENDGLARLSVPMLMLAGSNDTISGYGDGMHRIFRKASGTDRCLLTFEEAGHNAAAPIPAPREAFTPTDRLRFLPAEHYQDPVWDTVWMNAVAQHFARAFLGLHLKGEADMARYLRGDWAGSSPGTTHGLRWEERSKGT